MNIYKQLVVLLGSRESAVEAMQTHAEDFIIDADNVEFRFIHTDHINSIQCEELGNDLYMLGCFNDSFLVDILNIDLDIIEIMQETGAYEAIGKLICSLNKLEDLQEAYCSVDGYGHHFAHYDHEEHEVGNYLVFRTN